MASRVHLEGVQHSLDAFYLHENKYTGSLKEIRAALMEKFEEDDRRRGVPYLQPTDVVSEDFIIEYTRPVEFMHGEVEGTDSTLDELVWDDDDSDDEVPEPHGSDESTSDPSVSPFSHVLEEPDDYEDFASGGAVEDYEDPEPEIAIRDRSTDWSERVTYGVDSDGFDVWAVEETPVVEPTEPEAPSVPPADNEPIAEVGEPSETAPIGEPKTRTERPKRKSRPQRRPRRTPDSDDILDTPRPRKPKRKRPQTSPESKGRVSPRRPVSDASDLFSDVSFAPPKRPAREVDSRPKPVSTTSDATYRSLRDLVKYNPGCTLEFASRHFPKSEIQKNITLGKVYLRNGKLGI